MIGVFIRCDEPGCNLQMHIEPPGANISRLKRKARRQRWQVGKEKHFCPRHRTVGKAFKEWET